MPQNPSRPARLAVTALRALFVHGPQRRAVPPFYLISGRAALVRKISRAFFKEGASVSKHCHARILHGPLLTDAAQHGSDNGMLSPKIWLLQGKYNITKGKWILTMDESDPDLKTAKIIFYGSHRTCGSFNAPSPVKGGIGSDIQSRSR